MKANILQRLLLYAVILPFALLTLVWYLIAIIASFDLDAAINIGQSGLGPIEEQNYGPYGTVYYPGGGGGGGIGSGGGGAGGYYGYTTATVTRTGARSTYATYMTLGSVLTWNTVSASRAITRIVDGDLTYYTYASLQTSYSPSSRTQYGYITTTGVFTDTTTSFVYNTLGGRALSSEAAQPTPSRGESVAAGPTATPTPARSVARTPPQKRAAPAAEELSQRHELVKRRRGGGGGGSGSSVNGEKVKHAFLLHVPNFLGLFWAAVTITWLLLRLCVGKMRTIAADKWWLGWLSIIGLASTLYSTIVSAVAVSESYLGAVWTGLMVCILVFSWLLLLALAGTWLWEHIWAKRHAYGQLHRSLAEHAECPPPTIAGYDHTVEQKWDTSPSGTPTTLPYDSGVPLGTPAHDPQQPPTASNYQQPVPLSPASPVNTQQIPSPSTSPVSGAQSYNQQFGNVPPPPGPAPAGYTYALVPIQNAGPPPQQQQQQQYPAPGQYAQPAAQYPQQGYGGQYGSQP